MATFLHIDDFSKQLNAWGGDKIPFLFIVDFELKKPLAFRLDELDGADIQFNLDGFSNEQFSNSDVREVKLSMQPISKEAYAKKFEVVKKALAYGDSFLTNLTIKTPVQCSHSLKELYQLSTAKYKLLFKNEFLVFSPECFVKIEKGCIYSYPMKGTLDASIPNAEALLLNDEKEKAEHVTIVDLIRNDLSTVAENVRVTKFRFLEHIKTQQKTLLQVSSEIVGDVKSNYFEHIGDLILSLLPAGSVSGAPKKKTLEIIRQAEEEERGYYTGVMGYFDGTKLDSAVMIRFIENVDAQLYYRSGGGITTQSDCDKEYAEALAKVYVPVI